MKSLLMAYAALLVGTSISAARQTDDELETETVRRASESLVVVKSDTINRVVTRQVTYSGIAVALVQGENPAQLLNPFAPDEYGTAEDSVVRDPITGNATGLKIFSIGF